MPDELTPVTRLEGLLNGDDIEPVTRFEQFLAGEDLEPVTRLEWFLKKAASGGGSMQQVYDTQLVVSNLSTTAKLLQTFNFQFKNTLPVACIVVARRNNSAVPLYVGVAMIRGGVTSGTVNSQNIGLLYGTGSSCNTGNSTGIYISSAKAELSNGSGTFTVNVSGKLNSTYTADLIEGSYTLQAYLV